MMARKKRVAIYACVSADGQTVENQIRELKAVAKRRGWNIAATFVDNGISGSKAWNKRPGYDALRKAVAHKECDVVAAWAVDRLGRSLMGLVEFLEQLRENGVDLFLCEQGIDTSTADGRTLLKMSGVFAAFERAMTRERLKAGLERAKSDGKRLGRPRIPPEKEAAIREARKAGLGINKIAREIGVGVKTVQRVVAETP